MKIPVWSYGVHQTPYLENLLGSSVNLSLLPISPKNIGQQRWLGWGAKPSAKRASWYAKAFGGNAVNLEDGFLRSYGTGKDFAPLSIVSDEVGIHYDCTRPSALENLLNSPRSPLKGIEAAASHAKSLILSNYLSKYNHAPMLDMALLRKNDTKRILVIDQTAGDLSVSLGGADRSTFDKMLSAAYRENPGATIYVKTHPEVSSGQKKGYLSHVQYDKRTVVLREAINPLSLIAHMDRVYVVTSTMGFEALLAGKHVTVFGMPWYAGWGATEDRQYCERRKATRSVDELFAAAYFHYSHYLNPETKTKGTIFHVIDWLVRQRKMEARLEGRIIAVGFRRWKAVNIKPMLSLRAKHVVFVDTADQAEALVLTDRDQLVFWGNKAPAGLMALANCYHTGVLRMEDGFVRSVGLGSDLIRPLSLALDRKGLYFDPTATSDMEDILNTIELNSGELAEANQVQSLMVLHGISKYNIETRQRANWNTAGKYVILVPGQVEDDASIRYGCTDVKTNLGLLQAARASHPDAFIVYKPHPDVTSGNRIGKISLQEASRYADHIETSLSIVSCIDACNAVHTMTSLTGFDALIRGKQVVTYGQPFYAGWGLTEDRVKDGEAFCRRHRTLSLSELIYGAMIRYPIYWDWELKGYTTCVAVIRKIIDTRRKMETRGELEQLKSGYFRRQLRKLRILMNAWRQGL